MEGIYEHSTVAGFQLFMAFTKSATSGMPL